MRPRHGTIAVRRNRCHAHNIVRVTVLVIVKVADGIALATDSAVVVPDMQGTLRTFTTAEKLIQLHDELPIAVLLTGSNAIGGGTVQFCARVIKQAFTASDNPELKVDTTSYRLQDIAATTTKILTNAIKRHWDNDTHSLCLVFAGYSSDSFMPEVWEAAIQFRGTTVTGPNQTLGTEETGVRAYGQPQVVERIICGFDRILMSELAQLMPTDTLTEVLRKHRWDAIGPFVPLPDAAALARYLVEATADISPYVPSHVTVRRPVDVAAISKHNGFRWIDRKDTY